MEGTACNERSPSEGSSERVVMALNEDDFESIARQLADLEEPSDVEDVSRVGIEQLGIRLAGLDRQLADMGELREPKTDEGRQLHSLRAAYLVQMAKKNLR